MRKRVSALRIRRLKLGLTLLDVCNEVGTSVQYLSLIERDRMPLTNEMKARLGGFYTAHEAAIAEENEAAA